MATLTIPDLPDDVHEALRARAANAGRSVEEEARRVIADQVAPGVAELDRRRAFDRDDAQAAALEIRRLVMAANGGRMPDDSVDQFVAEKRAEVAAEEAEFAASLAVRRKGAGP